MVQKEPINFDLDMLKNIVNEANKIVVREYPTTDCEILYLSDNFEDIKEFVEALTIKMPAEPFDCMCHGSPQILIYKNDNLVIEVTNHHGVSLRCSLWEGNIPILDIEKWLKWFDERKIVGPRNEYLNTISNQNKAKKSSENWFNGMPASIRSIWDWDYFQSKTKITHYEKEVEKEFPEKNKRIIELLKWFSCGEGRWSGFPAYEDIAEKMLLKYSTDELLVAILQCDDLTECIEGTARLFGGWNFRKSRPNDLKIIPKELKERFWNHVKDTTDSDKLLRAKKSFT